MRFFADLLRNRMLCGAVLSWFAAQVLKTIIYAVVNKTLDFSRLVGDGGMPSGHSATVTALAVTAAIEYGVGSPLFAVASIFAIVVMHDAMGVRREAGKHAKALNEIFQMMAEGEPDSDKMLKELLGHTPLQVMSGMVLGVIMACIFEFVLV